MYSSMPILSLVLQLQNTGFVAGNVSINDYFIVRKWLQSENFNMLSDGPKLLKCVYYNEITNSKASNVTFFTDFKTLPLDIWAPPNNNEGYYISGPAMIAMSATYVLHVLPSNPTLFCNITQFIEAHMSYVML